MSSQIELTNLDKSSCLAEALLHSSDCLMMFLSLCQNRKVLVHGTTGTSQEQVDGQLGCEYQAQILSCNMSVRQR